MADSTSPIQQIAAGSNAVDRVNENFDAASPALMYGRDARTTAGLIWGIIGGRWGGDAISNGSLALAANATNYVVVNRSTGAVSVSTASTNWNNTATYARAYLVVTGAASVTSYQDHRAGPNGTETAPSADLQSVTLADDAASSTLPTAGSAVTIASVLQALRNNAKWLLTRFNASGFLSLSFGGTGAGDAPTARANLGLGNVDNTSDTNKPISIATQAALDLKANPGAAPEQTPRNRQLGSAAYVDKTWLHGSAAGVSAAIAASARPTVVVAVPGAELGDFAQVSLSTSPGGIEPRADVTAAGEVTVREINPTASGITLGAHTVYVRVDKRIAE